MSRKDSALFSSAAAAAFLLSTNAANAASGAAIQIDEHGFVKIDEVESQLVLREILSPEIFGELGETAKTLDEFWVADNGKCSGNGKCCCNPV